MDPNSLISSPEELAEVYDPPSERALLKQIDRLDEHARAFISASPFLLLATCGRSTGADCSPRGDEPGFVHVLDERTLLLPDRPGNNRLDSVRNILANPCVGLLFLVPGVDETLRVNGRATISVAPDLLGRFVAYGKPPRSVLVISVEEAFVQCSRALVRSDLWNPAKFADRAALPSIGTVLAAHTGGQVDAAAYDAEVEERVRATLY